MAKVDINAIRKRLEQINSGGNRDGGGSKWKRWKYDAVGVYTVRVLPFKDADPGMPFPERTVYYGIQGDGKGMIVSPENNGAEDPIKNFRINLYAQAKNTDDPGLAEELKAQAKLLSSKTINSVAIVDRANEDAGPHMWSPNYTDVQQLLALFMTDAGDYTDLADGCDLDIVVAQSKKIVQSGPRKGQPVLEAKISAKRANSPAHKDPAVLKAWLEAMPVLDDYYPVASTEDTERKLQEWLEAGAHRPDSDGTSRGGASATPAAKQPESVSGMKVAPQAERKATTPPPAKPKAEPKKLLADVEDNIDDALAELIDT